MRGIGVGLVLALISVLIYGLMLVNETQTWQGTLPYRWVVLGRERESAAVLFSLDSEGLLVLTLPADVMVRVTGSRGEYRIGSLVSLGNLEHKARELVINSLTTELRLPIRGAVIREGSLDPDLSAEEALALARSSLFSALLRRVDSGMQQRDVFDAWKRTQEEGTDRLARFKAEQLPILIETTSIDGQALRTLDTASFVRAWQKVMVTRESGKRSDLSVWVENNTALGGIGTETASILEGDGYDVVGVSDGTSSLPYTIINVALAVGLDDPYIKEMRWLFPTAEWRVTEALDYRADVVVRLGVTSQGVWTTEN